MGTCENCIISKFIGWRRRVWTDQKGSQFLYRRSELPPEGLIINSLSDTPVVDDPLLPIETR